jgi:hypothetical protein
MIKISVHCKFCTYNYVIYKNQIIVIFLGGCVKHRKGDYNTTNQQ